MIIQNRKLYRNINLKNTKKKVYSKKACAIWHFGALLNTNYIKIVYKKFDLNN
jgi:hypothetical protein